MREQRIAAFAALSVAGALALGGCATGPLTLGDESSVVTAGLNAAASGNPTGTDDTREKSSVKSKDAARDALGVARALRDKGDKAGALAELERGLASKPGDRELAREAGLVALELGQLDKARKALEIALDSSKPDWNTLSALGTVHATVGNQREAQRHFQRALELKPNHQPTLNNLAMSYALDGKLVDAERTLRSVASGGPSDKQIQENLALVLALAGKFADAEKVATGVMPKEKVKANLVYVRAMTQQGS